MFPQPIPNYKGLKPSGRPTKYTLCITSHSRVPAVGPGPGRGLSLFSVQTPRLPHTALRAPQSRGCLRERAHPGPRALATLAGACGPVAGLRRRGGFMVLRPPHSPAQRPAIVGKVQPRIMGKVQKLPAPRGPPSRRRRSGHPAAFRSPCSLLDAGTSPAAEPPLVAVPFPRSVCELSVNSIYFSKIGG